MSAAMTTLDHALMGWMRAFHAPWLDAAMIWTSASGGAGLVWLVLALIGMVMGRDRQAAWRVLLAVALSYALVDGVIKPIIGRARPAITDAASLTRDLPPLPTTSAFPSGHATSSFASAVTVSRMWPQTRVVWWILAALIGYSRIYLGHHYPLDIVAGAFLGIGVAWWVLGGLRPHRPRGRAPLSSRSFA